MCLCSVCRPTGGGGGVAGSDATQRAVDHHDVADVDGIVAQVLLPVAVGVLDTWGAGVAGEGGVGSGGQRRGGCSTVVPQQDDVGAAVQLQLLQAVHHLTDEVIKGLQRAAQLPREAAEGGQRSERSREVSGCRVAHLVLVGAVLMSSAVRLLGVNGVNMRPERNTRKTTQQHINNHKNHNNNTTASPPQVQPDVNEVSSAQRPLIFRQLQPTHQSQDLRLHWDQAAGRTETDGSIN